MIEADGMDRIPVRRSTRLICEPPPSSPPLTTPPVEPNETHVHYSDLPDLGGGMELVELQDMHVDSIKYTSSLKINRVVVNYSSTENTCDSEDSEPEAPDGGGIDNML